jgi:hypothetical protein
VIIRPADDATSLADWSTAHRQATTVLVAIAGEQVVGTATITAFLGDGATSRCCRAQAYADLTAPDSADPQVTALLAEAQLLFVASQSCAPPLRQAPPGADTRLAHARRLVRLDLPPFAHLAEAPSALIAHGRTRCMLAAPIEIAGDGLRLWHDRARLLGLAPGDPAWVLTPAAAARR